MSLLYDFLSLLYPRVCAACGNSLFRHEELICSYCLYHLPKTGFHHETDNPVSRLFWGRVQLESAAAFYYFRKGGLVQQLIHQLKYKGKKEIGIFLGKLYGIELKNAPGFHDAEMIIPVPLHIRKERKRGYNQSQAIAEGLSASLQIPYNTSTLVRASISETQTRKSRFSRWENVRDIFEMKNPETFQARRVILVDDVITTGATLEACANKLLQVPDLKISVAALAWAVNL